MLELIDRLRAALAEAGLERAVLSHPETLAHLCLFDPAVEEWPVANPFVASPALLSLVLDEATLLVASFHAAHAARSPVPVTHYRSYDYESPPDPARELAGRLVIADGQGPIGIEASSLPVAVADVLRLDGSELVPIDDLVIAARKIKLPIELDAIRRASHLSDIVQGAVKELAQPGMTEAEVAAQAQAVMAKEAGRRVPAILTVTTGVATSTGGWEATDRVIQPGDLVLCDSGPWIDGHWSDGANAVVAGEPPSAEQRRIFDRVRRALELAIELCRPGALACDVDTAVRAELADLGPTYPHHTGHGIGASWSEPPRITPYERTPLEEGMVLAVEPAFYAEGFGGIRLEHVFVVRAGGNDILTRFEHTL